MFTGLVQGTGRVTMVEERSCEKRLRIAPSFALTRLTLTESIAVNGVCLTVVETGDARGWSWFTIYASAETLRTTSLGQLRTDDQVNLERALAFGDRLGGHLVTGHVDCIATVTAVSHTGESLEFCLKFPRKFTTQVVAKGSVALDGISLTINRCGDDYLTVNIIPTTQSKTTIINWQPGRKVNMETDCIGKYVQRILEVWQNRQTSPKVKSLSTTFLAEHGFLNS